MVATTATSAEKAELWPKIVAAYKGYAGYQKRTERDIPITWVAFGSVAMAVLIPFIQKMPVGFPWSLLVSLLIVVFTFVKDNIANAADWVWLRKAGGMLGDGHEVPSHRFNAGEKGMFWWGVCTPGLVVVGSGLVLDLLVPGWGQTRGQMQVAHMIHALAAVIMMTMLIGHIYMGTVGVKGALGAMKTGWVDEGWAREHHSLWLDDIKAGRIPAQRSLPAGAAAPGSAPAIPS